MVWKTTSFPTTDSNVHANGRVTRWPTWHRDKSLFYVNCAIRGVQIACRIVTRTGTQNIQEKKKITWKYPHIKTQCGIEMARSRLVRRVSIFRELVGEFSTIWLGKSPLNSYVGPDIDFPAQMESNEGVKSPPF